MREYRRSRRFRVPDQTNRLIDVLVSMGDKHDLLYLEQ